MEKQHEKINSTNQRLPEIKTPKQIINNNVFQDDPLLVASRRKSVDQTADTTSQYEKRLSRRRRSSTGSEGSEHIIQNQVPIFTGVEHDESVQIVSETGTDSGSEENETKTGKPVTINRRRRRSDGKKRATVYNVEPSVSDAVPKSKTLQRNKSDVNLLVDAFHGKVRKQSFISAKGSLFKDHSLEDFENLVRLEEGKVEPPEEIKPPKRKKSIMQRKMSRFSIEFDESQVPVSSSSFVSPYASLFAATWHGFTFFTILLFTIWLLVVDTDVPPLAFGISMLGTLALGVYFGSLAKKSKNPDKNTLIQHCRIFKLAILPFWLMFDVCLFSATADLLKHSPTSLTPLLFYKYYSVSIIPLGFATLLPSVAKVVCGSHTVVTLVCIIVFQVIFRKDVATSEIVFSFLFISTLCVVLCVVCNALSEYEQDVRTKLANANIKYENLNKVRQALAEQYKAKKTILKKLLPAHIEKTLGNRKNHNDTTVGISDTYKDVTILFCDLVGFTTWCSELDSEDLVVLLSDLFSVFDMLSEKYGTEKIKTIGDCYMVAGGIPIPREDHAEKIVAMALDMMEAVSNFKRPNTNIPLVARIGIHSGSIIAAVIGIKKLSYDVFGDSVNMASRMESSGIPGKIQVSKETYELIRHKFYCTKRAGVKVKGKGDIDCYIVHGRHEDFPQNEVDSSTNRRVPVGSPVRVQEHFNSHQRMNSVPFFSTITNQRMTMSMNDMSVNKQENE